MFTSLVKVWPQIEGIVNIDSYCKDDVVFVVNLLNGIAV